jgi:putative membrane protein
MTWWCSAQNLPWSWTWQAYPGVWLFLGIIIGTYAWSVKRLGDEAQGLSRREVTLFVFGVALLWLAADWPVGKLGAGYLLSVHQAQYVVFTMVVPPLLLLGTPAWLLRRLVRLPAVRAGAKVLTRPLPALAVFNAVVVLTHLPEVVDGLMDSQFGSFALDVVWIGAGFVLWWPAVRRVPEFNGLTYGARFAYLLVATLLPMVPAAFLTFADYPIYATYELAPRVADLSSGSDQLAAGLVMKFGGDAVILLAISVIFFRWHAAEVAQDGLPVISSRLPKPQNRG